jgi:heptosyltransferase-2
MNTIIIRFSSLGDCVLLCPFLNHLKASGAGEVTVVTKADYVALFSAVPGVDRVVGLGKKGGIRALLQIAQGQKGHESAVIDAHNNWRSRLLSRQLGGADARIRKFYQARLGLILFKIPADIPSVRERYTELGTALGFPRPREGFGWLQPPPSCERRVLDALSELDGKPLAVAPGSRWPMKQWPQENYIELLKRIVRRHGYIVLLLGDEKDRAVTAAIEQAIGTNVLNLTGRTSILEAAGFIKHSVAFIGSDSGLMHLSEAVGVPVLALFGPTVEAFGYYPSLPRSKVCERDLSCRPCSRNGSRPCPKGTQECLTGIGVDDVENIFLDLLREEGPPRYILP